MADNIVIPLHGPSLEIIKSHGKYLCEVFSSKFGCVATFEGVDTGIGSSFAQSRAPVVPQKRFSVKLREGVTVSVWKGDLTCPESFPVEAVVNAANSGLQHGGGLAGALSTAGGPQIQNESDDYVSTNGQVITGDAITLGPGYLKCRMIIHAVGPHLLPNPTNQEVSQAEPLLNKVIWSILDRVGKNYLRTVAIPAISSGLFNYPLHKCAETIVWSLKKYYEHSSGKGHLPKEIFLVNNDEPTVQEMESACRSILGGQQPASYSQAAASNTRRATRASGTTMEIGNVCLTLKKGAIEDQEVDVIVNTADKKGDLSIGQISSAIRNKAGYKMQEEMNTAHTMGLLKVTKPYKLKCKEVYHTFCEHKTVTGASQLLIHSVSDCLYRAAGTDHKSIAFPAIGTGQLGFEKREVASLMLNSVTDFSQKSHKRLDVYFVIFPSDHDTFKAFEEQIKSLRQTSPHPSLFPAMEKDRNVQRSEKTEPRIAVSGPCKESLAEARNWYHRLFRLFDDISIYNNFILHFGEEEHRQLTRLMTRGVSIEENFANGNASIKIRAPRKEDTIAVVLQVEAMLCQIQQQFISEEEKEIGLLRDGKVFYKRTPFKLSSTEFLEEFSVLKRKLLVVKVEKVENPALKALFDLKKKTLKCHTPQKMFQRIPAQFCETICRIGFHAECAPPEDPKYGEGIYFASSIEKAMTLWKEQHEEFVYLVGAEVLTGNSAPGKPGMILPPPVGSDPLQVYDSLSGNEVSVIFSTYQALPKYIFTCMKR